MARKSKKTVRRAIVIRTPNQDTNQVLELSKVTGVRLKKNMLHLDQMEDGTWRLIYNSKMIPDFADVESLEILRED